MGGGYDEAFVDECSAACVRQDTARSVVADRDSPWPGEGRGCVATHYAHEFQVRLVLLYAAC